MTLAELLAAVMWIGMTAYVVFGGADFGAGFWDLVAGGAGRGRDQRTLIEHVIGPVWETNHVWLIFVIVVMWTAFPAAFAAVASTMYIPLTGAASGSSCGAPGSPSARRSRTCRSSGCSAPPSRPRRCSHHSSSARVPLGSAAGDLVTSWLNPTSLLGGVLAVAACAYRAAVFLTADARRERRDDLAEAFRVRALGAGLVSGAIALGGVMVLRTDAPQLYEGLTGRALPLMLASAAGGIAALALLWQRRYAAARVASAEAVAAVIWGWAVGQYPAMLVGSVTIAEAAAGRATLQAMLVALAIGTVLVVPSLVWLYVLFQRHPGGAEAADALMPQAPSPDHPRPTRAGAPAGGASPRRRPRDRP
jgi:cytochrome d ubiquinol oxidase subunit II